MGYEEKFKNTYYPQENFLREEKNADNDFENNEEKENNINLQKSKLDSSDKDDSNLNRMIS